MSNKALLIVSMLYALSFYAALVIVDVWATMVLWGSALGLSLWESYDAKD